jgi:pyruvate/2-oxoglutarate dehydrogenase complex dihydrolipoamide acyltransferase (E2) component
VPNQEQEWVARREFDLPDPEAESGRTTFVRGEPVPNDLVDENPQTKDWDLVVLSNSDEGIKAYDQFERLQEAEEEREETPQERQAREDAELHPDDYVESIIGETEEVHSTEENPDLSPEEEAEVLAELHSDDYIADILGDREEPEAADPDDSVDFTYDDEGNVVRRGSLESGEIEAERNEDLHADLDLGDRVDEREEIEEVYGPGGAPTVLTHPPSESLGIPPGDQRLTQSPIPADSPEDVDATDGARLKAEELGVDLTQVEGSGNEGRVTQRDVERHASRQE